MLSQELLHIGAEFPPWQAVNPAPGIAHDLYGAVGEYPVEKTDFLRQPYLVHWQRGNPRPG